MWDVLTNDHFLLGVGLATGPAIIVCILIYLFFKYVKDTGKTATTTDSLMSMEGGPYHSGLERDVSFLAEECKAIWLEIKEINQRQMSLRERLPRDYVSKDDLKSIQTRLGNIDRKLDRYYELGIHNRRESK